MEIKTRTRCRRGQRRVSQWESASKVVGVEQSHVASSGLRKQNGEAKGEGSYLEWKCFSLRLAAGSDAY